MTSAMATPKASPNRSRTPSRRIPREALDRIPHDDAQGGEVAREVVCRRHPEVGAEEAVGPLEQRAREDGAAAVAHLGGQLLGLDQDGAGQPLRLIEFGDGALPLSAVAGDIGAFFGGVLLGLRAELFEPGLGGVALRREVGDEGAQALGDRVDALAQALKLGVRQVAPIERGLLLIEVKLKGVELRPQSLGFGRERRRRSRRRGRVANAGPGVIGLLGLWLSGRWLSLGERSLGKSGRCQRAGVCDQHKRAAGDYQGPAEGFEEGRHHADLSYPNLLQIENRLKRSRK